MPGSLRGCRHRSPSGPRWCRRPRSRITTLLPGLLDTLNGVVAAAAARHGFQFVDVTSRFVDHGVNAPDPWVLGPSDPGAFQPTVNGCRAHTAALTAAIFPARLR